MIWYSIFLVFLIQRVRGKECYNGYTKVHADDICIHLSTRPLKQSDMRSYCAMESGHRGKPLQHRFSDLGLKEVLGLIREKVGNIFPDDIFIGMRREEDQMGQPLDTFKFEKDGGTVKDKEYPLWTGSSEHMDCGLVSFTTNFKVKPASCSGSYAYMCEKKDPPCYGDIYKYAQYHGRCLQLIRRKNNYDNAGAICAQNQGHLAPYKSEDETDAFAEAIYNSVLDGGIHAGLQRNEAGKWVYGSGEEETSRWDPEDDREFDCGVYRLIRNLTLALYTVRCEQSLRGICQQDESNSDYDYSYTS